MRNFKLLFSFLIAISIANVFGQNHVLIYNSSMELVSSLFTLDEFNDYMFENTLSSLNEKYALVYFTDSLFDFKKYKPPFQLLFSANSFVHFFHNNFRETTKEKIDSINLFGFYTRKDSAATGIWCLFDNSGAKPKRIEYFEIKYNYLNGSYMTYDHNGNLSSFTYYKNGIPNGVSVTLKDSSIQQLFFYENCSKSDFFSVTYENKLVNKIEFTKFDTNKHEFLPRILIMNFDKEGKLEEFKHLR